MDRLSREASEERRELYGDETNSVAYSSDSFDPYPYGYEDEYGNCSKIRYGGTDGDGNPWFYRGYSIHEKD